MKILHLLPSLDSGGMETFAFSLVRQQRQDGLDASIALFSGRGFAPQRSDREGIPIWEFNRDVGTWRLAREVRALLIRGKFDLLHSHNETSTIFGAIATWDLRSVAFVSTIHNGDRGNYTLKQRLENYLAFTRCDAIISVSEKIVETMVTREFVQPAWMRVIKNGIMPVEAISDVERKKLKESLHIQDVSLVLGCVGRLVPVKNHILFLSAFKQALTAYPDMVLVLVGDGPLRQAIEAAVQSLDLSVSVRLAGDRKDVPALLNMMDIFALPSLNEGHSISLLEAFSAGKPVIASNRGGNPTLVADGRTGLLVDPENVAAMAEAIIRLAGNPGLRASLGDGGRKLQRELYGMEICSRNYLELYLSLR